MYLHIYIYMYIYSYIGRSVLLINVFGVLLCLPMICDPMIGGCFGLHTHTGLPTTKSTGYQPTAVNLETIANLQGL